MLRTRLGVQLGLEVRGERLRRNWSMQDLAGRAGLSASAVLPDPRSPRSDGDHPPAGAPGKDPTSRIAVNPARCARTPPIIRTMVIAIDAGNSAVKVALVHDHRIEAAERLPTSDAAARRDIGELIASLLERDRAETHARGRDRRGVVLVSVVPAWTEAVMHAAVAAGVPLLIADHGSIPIETRLLHPERVGPDRLLNAYAAERLHGSPVIVVDLGTATTVDAVDSTGAFAGGAIMPGLELGLRALAGGTALLPQVDTEAPAHAIGVDTTSAIQSGAVFGHVGAVRDLVARMATELGGGRPKVFVTGGFSAAAWARLFVDEAGPGGRIADLLDPQLTLRGLAILHDELAAVHA